MFERPEVVGMGLVATAAGIAACVWLMPPDFSLPWRIGAGVALGIAATLLLFANRMIGGSDFD
jgi:hypothetical protein